MEFALLLLSIYFIDLLSSIFPVNWFYYVEEGITPLSVVEQRLWEKNWFYVNWFLFPLQFVATFIYNPAAWIVQANLNFCVWLFSPIYYFVFVEWPGYFDFLYTRYDVLVDLYGFDAVQAETVKISNLILAGWVIVMQSILTYLSYLFYFNCAF